MGLYAEVVVTMDEVICNVDFTPVLTELTDTNLTLVSTNEYLLKQIDLMIISMGVLVGLSAFLTAALLVVMVSVWRRS